MERQELIKWIISSHDNAELMQRYDQWAADYDGDLDEVFGWIAPDKAAEVLSQFVPTDARVLDAGAGTGLVGRALADRGYTNLVAGDISTGMLQEARKKNIYVEFHRITLGEELEFAANSFDAIISVGVFTPGHAPASSLDELVRITKHGGYIVYTLRSDWHEPGGFKDKQKAFVQAGKWIPVEASEPFQPLPKGEPDVTHQVWVYRVL